MSIVTMKRRWRLADSLCSIQCNDRAAETPSGYC
jgi:hypothetical protein